MAEFVTQRQREVLSFISDHIRAHNYPPTIRQIGDAFDFRSTNATADHLKALIRKGLIERAHNSARAMWLTPKGKREAASASLYATSTGAEVAR
jgi:repressor LexA